MQVFQGRSFARDPVHAVAEATRGCPSSPSMVFAFGSSAQETEGVARALVERFPEAAIAGCSTAGEYLGGERSRGSLVVAAVRNCPTQWATRNIPDIARLQEQEALAHVDALFGELDIERDTFEPSDYFALMLIDGMSLAEERATAMLADALDGIPLAGGSAGDDLSFKATTVYSDKGPVAGGAVLVVANRKGVAVEFIKHQHFVSTSRLLCVTRAAPSTRTVYEIDGLPAAEAYASALGLAPDALTIAETFRNPLSFLNENETYVRSVRTINEDGSLTFYCGIDEGMVLDVSRHDDQPRALDDALSTLTDSSNKADLLLGFNCVLRSLEAEEAGTHAVMQQSLNRFSSAMIGFDTYGEQFDGLHINQTLVAVALRDDRKTC